jgi:hypothetical protein
MVLGSPELDPSVIEVLTGSAFGATSIAGLPFFSPAGWDPDIGLDQAMAALGWACERTAGGEATAAIDRPVPYPSAPFTMRAGFHRTHDLDVATALRRSLLDAVRWLEASGPGERVERLAGLVTAGLDEHTHGHLVHFALRVGARRLADASVWLGTIGHASAAEITDRQARLLGALQYDLVSGAQLAAAGTLLELAPTYAELRVTLLHSSTPGGR